MPDQKLCNTHRLRSVNIQQKPLTPPEVCVLPACCPCLGNPVFSPDAPNDLGSKWSAMEWIYTVGLGSCLMHLLHNGYRKATITFISDLTKFTSNVKTSSICSRRSNNIMWPLHSTHLERTSVVVTPDSRDVRIHSTHDSIEFTITKWDWKRFLHFLDKNLQN